MSIIQEALKKAEKAEFDKILPDEPAKPTVTTTSYKADDTVKKKSFFSSVLRIVFFTLFIVALIALSVIMSAQYSANNVKKTQDIIVIEKKVPVEAPKIEPVIPKEEPKLPDVPPAPEYVLSGIVQLSDGTKAIINGESVEEGEDINGALVEAIGEDRAVLSKDGKKIVLRIK